MGKSRILAIDDEPRILDIVKYFLEQGGYEVEAFTEPSQGLAAAKKRPFDAIVLDIVLGKTSGYAVAGELKRVKNAENPPILFMSSKVEMADLFLKHYDGRAEFIQKPFKKEDFLQKVGGLLEGGGARKPAGAPAARRKK